MNLGKLENRGSFSKLILKRSMIMLNGSLCMKFCVGRASP
jgi:hypothetical protein